MDTPRGSAAAARRVNAYLARHVPITRAMGIRLRAFDAGGVRMTAPLAPNINDKGIAFGGTLASILALSGWALTDLVLRGAGLEADVLIALASTEYRAPVAGEIVARCPLPPRREVAAFLAAYRLRGRARLRLEAFVEAGGVRAAVFAGTYVARPRAAARAPVTAAGPAPPPRSARRTPPPSGRSRTAPSARR